MSEWTLEIVSFDHHYDLDSIARKILQGETGGFLRDGLWTLIRSDDADIFKIYNAVKNGKMRGQA